MSRSFCLKSRLCLLVLLCSLFLGRISCSADLCGQCEYTIENDVLTIQPASGDTVCTLGTSFPWAYDDSIDTVKIKTGVATGESAAYLFALPNCAGWSDLQNLDVSQTTNFSGMFSGCNMLGTDALDYIQNWEMDNATNTSDMFESCLSISNLGALAGWNVNNIINMSEMFYECKGLTNLDGLENWQLNTSSNYGVDLSSMFYNCSSLTNLKGLENWNVIKVNSLYETFYGCKTLTTLDDLKKWTLNGSQDMDYTFYACSGLTSLEGIKSWNVSNVTSLDRTFYRCSSLANLKGLDGWSVDQVTTFERAFYECSGLTDIEDIKGWNVENAGFMNGMFEGCSKLTKVDALKDWNTQNVEHMGAMFKGCTALSNIDGLDGRNVTGVKSFESMFYGCSALTNLDAIKGWIFGGKPSMSYMFYNCKGLTSLDGIKSWDMTKSSGSLASTFENCSGLTSLDGIKGWDISKITNWNSTFKGCSGLTSLDGIKNWNVINVTNWTSTFENCSGLTGLLEIKDWDVSNIKNVSKMFSGCSNVKTADFSGWDFSKSGLTYSNMLNGVSAAVKLNQYYSGMSGTKLYVLGKHSYLDFQGKTNLSTNPSNLVFEPCIVSVAADTHGSVTLSANTYTDPEAYYTAVSGFTDAPQYEAGTAYHTSGSSVTVTVTPNAGCSVLSVTATDESGNQISLSAPDYQLSNIQSDYTISVDYNLPSFTVTYDAGDAEDGSVPADQTVQEEQDAVVAANSGSLTKAGFEFAGWKSDYDSNTYLPGDTFPMPGTNVTLTAVFVQVYSLTYEGGDADSGSVPTAEQLLRQGAAVTVAQNSGNFARTGYTFAGWKRSDNGNIVLPDATFSMPGEAVTLTAQFVINGSYLLSYAAGDAESGKVPDSENIVEAMEATVAGNSGNLARTGYTFAGWKRSDNGEIVLPDATFPMPGYAVTLTAQFTVNSYTITYEMGEATSGKVPVAQVWEYNEPVTLSANTGNLAKGNAPYLGWTDDVTEYTERHSFLMPAYDMTIKPLFSKLFKLTFAAGEAESGRVPDAIDVYFKNSVVLPGNTGNLTKADYIFSGWSDETTEYKAGDSFEMPKRDVTLTAVFVPDNYTITYEMGDAERGTVPAPQTNIPANASVKLALNTGGLAKEGYEFTYWTDGLKWYVPGSDYLMPMEDVILWPVFTMVIREEPLPEDEIGTYYYNESGQKEYVQFHNYDICMNYMGNDDLCRNTSTNLYN